MTCLTNASGDQYHLVGDPVDVITGASTEIARAFMLTGPIPLGWDHYYHSHHHQWQRPLGWGRSHGYDHWIQFDADGVCYTDPAGEATHFPFLLEDGQEASDAGYTLIRVAETQYRITRSGQPTMVFQLPPLQAGAIVRAPLNALIRGEHTVQFIYNAKQHLQRIIDSKGRQIQVQCDGQGRIQSLTWTNYKPNTPRTLMHYRYDEAGNVVQATDPYHHSCQYAYDANNRLVRNTDRRGYSFHFEYDKQGRCTHSVGDDGLWEVDLRYLPEQRTTIVTKADGGQWLYFYDETKVLTQINDPYGGTLKFIQDEQGRVVAEEDANGNITQWQYNSAGALVGKIDPLGHYKAVPEDPNADDPTEHRVADCAAEWDYGDLLNLDPNPAYQPPKPPDSPTDLPESNAVTPAGVSDSPDRSAEPTNGFETDAQGRVHDPMGQLVREWGPDGTSRRWVYDPVGNIVRTVDRDGAKHEYEYTSWDLRSRAIDPLGHAVKYKYNTAEKITAVIDAGNATSEYDYDYRDRISEIRRHDTVKEQYRYDNADNLIEKLDGQGQTLLTFEIGPGNLKTKRKLASGEEHRFEYDDVGRFLAVSTNHHDTRFAYNDLGDRIQDQRDGLGVEHEFDALGVTQTTVLGQFVIQYDRPDDDSLVITDPGGQKHTIRLLGNGVVQRDLSSGVREEARYDSEGRCLYKTVLQHPIYPQPWQRQYEYSAEGDLLSAADNRRGRIRYEYDAAHRLSQATHPSGRIDEYHYDDADNLLAKPGLEEVKLRQGNRLLSANHQRFEYNDRNAISAKHGRDGQTQYTYDSRDMLVGVQTNQGNWQAEYDPLGRRTSKTYKGKTTQFYWDTDRLAAEVAPDGRVRVYIYADAVALVPVLFMEYDSLDADPASGKRYFIFTDHLGTPIRVEDDHGHTAWTARIDPYGTAHVDEGNTIRMPLRFPGHYYDTEIGLHYNRFRYYSPELGRYLQSDPLGIFDDEFNLYAYTRNPLRWVDVRGLCPDSDPPPKKKEDGEDSEATPGNSAQQKRAKMEALRERRRQQKEQQRQDALREKRKAAEAKGKHKYPKVTKDEEAWLAQSDQNKDLAYDPAPDKFKVDEAKAAQAAEADGKLKPPVTRASDQSGNEMGDDFFDGNGQGWDAKEARDIPRIQKAVDNGERVIVHGSASDVAAAEQALGPESDSLVYVVR